MPTQHSRKHNNEANMILWRASTIYRLISEQIKLKGEKLHKTQSILSEIPIGQSGTENSGKLSVSTNDSKYGMSICFILS